MGNQNGFLRLLSNLENICYHICKEAAVSLAKRMLQAHVRRTTSDILKSSK